MWNNNNVQLNQSSMAYLYVQYIDQNTKITSKPFAIIDSNEATASL